MPDGSQLFFKFREFNRRDVPDLIIIHLHVLMGDNIPHIVCVKPWDLWKSFSRFARYHVRRFADNHDVALRYGLLVVACKKFSL